MIRLKRTFSEEEFSTAKADIESQAPILASLSLNDISFTSNETLDVSGRQLALTDLMFRRIMQQIAIPQSNQKTIKKNYGDDALYELGNLMLRTDTSNDRYLLSFDNNDGTLQNFNKLDNQVISLDSGFTYIDALRNHYNLEVGEVLYRPSQQGIAVNMYFPKESQSFSLGGGEDHIHGVSVRLLADSVQVNSYVNRLVCENGAVVTLSEKQHILSDVNSESIKSSVAFINATQAKVEENMKESYRTCQRTTASIAEVERAGHGLLKAKISQEYVAVEFPLHQYKEDYATIGVDLDSCTMPQKSGMESDMTVWELYNKMTAFATHTEHLDVHSPFRLDLMNTAAKISGSSKLDLANRFPSPY